jgi:hypothetical protein
VTEPTPTRIGLFRWEAHIPVSGGYGVTVYGLTRRSALRNAARYIAALPADEPSMGHDCMAGFVKVLTHLGEELEKHADRDGLTGVRRAVFLSRGGHAPGTVCPTETPTDPHEYWCEYPDDECRCSAGRL